jgi:type III restriction enzyme
MTMRETSVVPYNTEWRIIRTEDGEDRIDMFRETKSNLDDSTLRRTVPATIKSAKRQFEVIGINDYA